MQYTHGNKVAQIPLERDHGTSFRPITHSIKWCNPVLNMYKVLTEVRDTVQFMLLHQRFHLDPELSFSIQ